MDSSSGASPSYIPPSTAPDSARLQRGLAALAKQDYRAAIALLTAALDENPSAAAARRARVGLVKAHQRLGEFSEAIAYCQPLLQVSHAPTRDWSRRALVALKKAIARQPPSDVNSRSVDSHDTRSSASSANAPGLADDPSPAEIETGFVPLSGADTEPADAPVADRASRPAEGLANSPTNQPSSTVPSVAISVSADAQTADAQTADAQTVDARTASTQAPSKSSALDQITSEQTVPKQATAKQAAAKASPAGRSLLSLPWRQAERAQRWPPTTAAPLFEQGIISLWTLMCLVALPSVLFRLITAPGSPVQSFMLRSFFGPWWWLQSHLTIVIGGVLLALWATSPWILQGVLQLRGAKPLASDRLSQISPEAGRLLKRQQMQPRLYSLPVNAPLVLSFGLHPRLSWLVVSEGLRQLSDEEIAALVAAELTHLRSITTACFTLMLATTQIPYTLYWSLASWGNRLAPPLQGVVGAAAALCYGLFWVLRWPGLWLSRWRRREGDRLATGLTGNPNALARALVLVSVGLATEQRRYPETAWLNGLASLLPVNPEAALLLESLARQAPSEFYGDLGQRLQWPCALKYRPWLTLNHTHPPLDERLRSLMSLAAQWRLAPEIPRFETGSSLSSAQMLLQAAPYWGGAAGACLALLLWGVGGVAGQGSPLGWLWGDRAILYGLTAIGGSMGLLARANAYFPDISASTEPANPGELLKTLGAPVQAVPIALQGRLVGPEGLKIALGQNLLLDASGGLIRLSFTSALGPGGNLFLGHSPAALLGQTVAVKGWLHRGVTAWVDVARISPAGSARGSLQTTAQTAAGGRRPCTANHPVWSTVVAFGLALWGAWTIYRGGA